MKYKNIYEVKKQLEAIIRSHPDVNSYMYGVYDLLEKKDILYPLVSLTENYTSKTSNSLLQLSVNLLYADRLTDDRSNMEFIQSVGTSVILECLNKAESLPGMLTVNTGYQISPFTEQFADNCAGVAATVIIQMPSFIGSCSWLQIDPCYKCK